MSGSKGKSKSRQSTQIDPFILEQIRSILGQGQQLAGEQLAPGSQFQQFQQGAQDALTGFLQPQENPFLQGQIEQGQNLITENLQQNILPSIGGQAAASGQRGGGRQGVAEGIALRDANRQSSDFAQNLIGQDFQGQQQRALQALGQAGQIGGLAFQPLQQLRALLGGNTTIGQSVSGSRSDSKSISGGVFGS